MGEFSNRFTIFPDSGTTELHCYLCNRSWPIGYHPSLDVLVERAREHNQAEHVPEGGIWRLLHRRRPKSTDRASGTELQRLRVQAQLPETGKLGEQAWVHLYAQDVSRLPGHKG